MEYSALAQKEIIEKTMENLKTNGVEGILVQTKEEALEKIKELIPAGASIMNGSSKTLEQIGLVDYLISKNHGWNNLHQAILEEKDPAKQSNLRKQAVLSDYYLGSVHALSQTGEFIIASNSGSQLPHIVYTSPNLIFVVGGQKIVSSIDEGLRRLEGYVIPREDENLMQKFNMHTYPSKLLIFKREPEFTQRKVTMIIVGEVLGF